MDPKRPRRVSDSSLARLKDAVQTGRFETAPQVRINDHPDVLADFMRQICDLEPDEYALSDESLLSDLDSIDTGELFAAVRRIYAIDVPSGRDQPFLWEVIEKIAAKRK
jgi:hypothetical protein